MIDYEFCSRLMLIGVEGTSLGQLRGLERTETSLSAGKECVSLICLLIYIILSFSPLSIFLISHPSSSITFIIAIKFLPVHYGNSLIIVRQRCEERPARRQCGESWRKTAKNTERHALTSVLVLSTLMTVLWYRACSSCLIYCTNGK